MILLGVYCFFFGGGGVISWMIYDEEARRPWIFHLWVIKHGAAVSDEARYNKGGNKEG